MDKNQLSALLNHYSGSSLQEAEGIVALKRQYPYSQLLHIMAARTAKDHNWSNHQSILQLAAVYSTDRTVLKEIMSADYAEYTAENATLNLRQSPLAVDYADEIMHDMERLQELKHNFEQLFMDSGGEADTTKKTVEHQELVQEAGEMHEQTTTEPKLSKRQRLIELAKELIPEDQPEKQKRTVRRENEQNPIIEEIKATKKKIQPANEKTKEQIELIEHYISIKPSLAPPKAMEQDNLDLASTLKSGEFGDNIVSETLAEILVKQGKKEKAIEVYKKLIWKFPQKKAYFAAQIEDLRK